MPTTLAHKTRHHSNLRPKHKHTKQYLQAYWPYIPLLVITGLSLLLLQPLLRPVHGRGVLGYATNISTSGLLQATNEERAADHETGLQLNEALQQAAQIKAEDMVTQNYWAHISPDGKAPWVFINNAGYQYRKAGENLAYGFGYNKDVLAGWMNSPSHRENILDNDYRDVGFGLANSANFDHNGPTTVVVALYGQPTAQAGTVKAIHTQHHAFNSFSSAVVEPPAHAISRIQAITGGLAPWSQFLVGLIAGGAVVYLLAKHSLQLKKAVKKSERFVVKHPLLDLTLVAIIVLGIIISQQAGVIR